MGVNEVGRGEGISSPGGMNVEEEKNIDKETPSNFDRLLEEKEKVSEEKNGGSSKKSVVGLKKSGKKKKGKVDLIDGVKINSLKMRTFEKRVDFSKSEGGISIDTKKLVDEIVSKMRVGVNRAGNSEVQIDLKSDVLEGLKISISLTKDGIVTSFEAANNHILEGIKERLPELVRGLEDKGVKVSDIRAFLKDEVQKEREERERRERRNRKNG